MLTLSIPVLSMYFKQSGKSVNPDQMTSPEVTWSGSKVCILNSAGEEFIISLICQIIISVFRVTALKILGMVGTHMFLINFFSGKWYILCILKGILEKI